MNPQPEYKWEIDTQEKLSPKYFQIRWYEKHKLIWTVNVISKERKADFRCTTWLFQFLRGRKRGNNSSGLKGQSPATQKVSCLWTIFGAFLKLRYWLK